MENLKEIYVSPSTETIEWEPTGVFCVSDRMENSVEDYEVQRSQDW